MTVTGFFKLYGVALIAFFVLDLLWLGVVARGFYQTHMGHLMKPSVNWAAAVIRQCLAHHGTYCRRCVGGTSRCRYWFCRHSRQGHGGWRPV